MGRKTAKLDVQASLSDHHDEQDGADLRAWRAFVAEVRELARKPEYAEIILWVNGDE